MSAYNTTMRPLIAAARHVQPIGLEEFSSSLLRLFEFKVPPVFGLAVSGGVDSMSLAILSKQFAEAYGTKAVAFTVDHKLRPTSTAEAQQISRTIKSDIGLEHRILNIDWTYVERRGIERAARTLRYNALAKSCVEFNIEHLLLAHTMDDQIETALIRLLRGSRTNGLAGMRRVSWIAGGKSIYGAENIKVLRPLLLEKKVRAIATCQSAHVPWVEDMTNHDPGYTKRNAIRVLLSDPEKLPEALQPDNIIMFCERLSERRRQIDLASLQLFQLEVSQRHIAMSRRRLLIEWSIYPEIYDNKELNLLISVLKRVITAISPISDPDVSTRQYQEIVRKLFTPIKSTFTFMGIKWTYTQQEIRTPQMQPQKSRHGGLPKKELPLSKPKWDWTTGALKTTSTDDSVQHKPETTLPSREKARHVWKLTREPLHDKYPVAFMNIPASGWSEWVFWDNRVWFRCRWKAPGSSSSGKPSVLIIRPFVHSDRAIIRKFGNSFRYSFERLTKNMKGVDITTLPVIHDASISRIIAFPSLDFLVEPRWPIEYEMKLKDFGFIPDKR